MGVKQSNVVCREKSSVFNYCFDFNVNISPSSDETAANAESTLDSLAAAIV